MLSPLNTETLLKRLDEELSKRGERRTLIVCGGAALLVMNVIHRRTRDIDVIAPELDPTLKTIAKHIGNEFDLSENWLNNGPASLMSDLSSGWQERCHTIFKGKALELRSLGREDLLASKLFAFCDREDDFEDVVRLKPSKEELTKLLPWVLKRDASAYWPKRVEECFSRLRKKMKYE